jgi:predicted 2-oxoglutarate/Fe(II)-dependent dioxygenase YbiX/peroxiredoxin
MRTQLLQPGEPAPWFSADTQTKPGFQFHLAAGRYVALCFFQSAARSDSSQILASALQSPLFDDYSAAFFGVSTDPSDAEQGRLVERHPGVRHFRDFSGVISRAYGAIASTASASDYRAHTLLLDPTLRVAAVIPFSGSPAAHLSQLTAELEKLPPLGDSVAATMQAPVLVAPRVFEPEFCRTLIDYYERFGGAETGAMREIDGKTVEVLDYAHKRRRDQEIQDEALRLACMTRIHDRLAPEIARVFQFRATRIERYVVACYDADAGGHFRPHRDNTTRGTAHRRFAVSLHLNTGEYEGGELRFPEFGPQRYSAPPGGAVVFSCSLLHEALPITAGKRFVFLPFLYDEAAARIRDENRKYVGKE